MNKSSARIGANGATRHDGRTPGERAAQYLNREAMNVEHIEDRRSIVELLNDALATQIVCALRYKQHYYTAQGPHANAARRKFAQQAADDLDHADRLAARIVQLGGVPDFNPEGLVSRSHTEYIEGDTLRDMMFEDVIPDQLAIEALREMLTFVQDRDPATHRLLGEIVAAEEEWTEELTSLMFVEIDTAGGAND